MPHDTQPTANQQVFHIETPLPVLPEQSLLAAKNRV
jgi:hypothetical protein